MKNQRTGEKEKNQGTGEWGSEWQRIGRLPAGWLWLVLGGIRGLAGRASGAAVPEELWEQPVERALVRQGL